MITVVTPASSRNLTTLASVLQYLGLESGEDDALLSSLIVAASRMIERMTGRIFAKQGYLEKLPPTDNKILVVTHTPIVSISSVSYNDAEISSDEYSIYSAEVGMLYRDASWGSPEAVRAGIQPFPTDAVEKLWSIQYVAGYVLPGDPDRDLPEDIELACLMLVRDLYYSRRKVSSVQSEKIGDYSVTYASRDTLLQIREILDPWSRIA